MNKKTVKSLKTGLIRRNLTLAKLSTRTAMSALSKKGKDGLYTVLRTQAKAWVDEMGVMKGALMKVGQMLTMLDDSVLPEDIKEIFRPLTEQSIAMEGEEIAKLLKKRLKLERFEKLEFDLTPYAAASIGQVHRARLKDTGEALVIKIQYPGIQQSLQSDMTTLKSLMRLLSAFPGVTKEKLDEGFLEIKKVIKQEIDYQKEAKYLELFQELLAQDERYVVPKVYRDFSTKTVLALSFESGQPLTKKVLQSLPRAKAQKVGLALIELFFRQAIEWQVLQTDTHSANYRLRIEGEEVQIVLLDFGAYIDIRPDLSLGLKELLRLAYEVDHEGLVATLFDLQILLPEDSQEIIDLHVELAYACLAAVLPSSHPVRAVAKKRPLNSPEWPEFVWDWNRRYMKAHGFRLRAVNPEFIYIGRAVLGMRQFLTELDMDWEDPLILELVEGVLRGKG